MATMIATQHAHTLTNGKNDLPLDKPFAAVNLNGSRSFTSSPASASSQANGSSNTQQNVDSIVASLSLPEKVFLLSGSGFTYTGGASKHGLHRAKTSDALSDVRGSTIYNAPTAAVFPNATALAATFDIEALEQIGRALGDEMALKTTECLLAPNLNLHRDPRAGRNNETFGEDPFLAGAAGTAIVKGIHSKGKHVCIKHLVCNDSEKSRREYNVQVDERSLREIYLRPFEAVVSETNPASIMTAYNSLNGSSASQHKELLTGIVRDEWKYDGLLMSDWFGTYDGIESLKAGMDLEMPFPATRGKKLMEAVAAGTVTNSQLNTSVKRVLNFLRRCDAPSASEPEQNTDNDEGRCQLLRQVAADSIILLKNDSNKLPLEKTKVITLAVIGSLATDRVVNHLASPSFLVNPLEGLQEGLAGTSTRLVHRHGPATTKLIPLLDKRYTPLVNFHLWNRGQRGKAGAVPVTTESHHDAMIAFLMRKVAGLDEDFEIEMVSTVKVPVSGKYCLGVVSASDAEVFLNGQKVYTFMPDGLVDVQRFLFYQHTFEQTFELDLEAGQIYDLRCISQSQKQSGPEPVATGLFFGMVEHSTREQRLQEAVEAAKSADEVVLCVGTTWEWEMEGVDRESLQLPAGQPELLEAIISARQGDVIVVNQSGAAVDLSCAIGAKAILHAHWGGQAVGHAIADVLFGRVNPSAKSPFTWPVRLEDCPSYGNFPHDENLQIRYTEGLNMGWRAYAKPDAAQPLFAFGHGMSYTTFEIRNARLSGSLQDANGLEFSIEVKNSGSVPGREVVQCYVEGPATAIERPYRSLEGFVKTRLLQPGEVQTVTVPLKRRAFSSWSPAGKNWIAEAGTYRIKAGTSSGVLKAGLSHSISESFTWVGLR